LFDDCFDGCDIDPCISSGPVAPDKRVRVTGKPCPVASVVCCATVHRVYSAPRTGPPI
jgi:hypothetical protein